MAIKIHCFLRQRREYRVLVNEFQHSIDLRPHNEDEQKYVSCARWNSKVNSNIFSDSSRKPSNCHRFFSKHSISLLTVPSAFGQLCRFTIISTVLRCHCRFLHGNLTPSTMVSNVHVQFFSFLNLGFLTLTPICFCFYLRLLTK